MTIGKRITELRKARKFTQEYIAAQLNVSRQAVSKWEKDQSAPDTKNLIALAELLNTSVEYLASGTRPDPEQSSASGTIFYKASTIPLTVLLLCHFIGLFTGEYTDMVTISVASGMRVGIPFLLYGRSTAAVVMLIISIVCLIIFALLLFLGYHTNKSKK